MIYIDPRYVEAGQVLLATEFDEILRNTLPEYAAEMSEGYAWQDSLPARSAMQHEADALAEHLASEYGII